MDVAILTRAERFARSLAHDVVCRRDGLSGWKARRDEFLRSLQRNRDALRADAEAKLKRILVHAYDTVPYYRAAWNAAGVDPSLFRDIADLQRFPYVNKGILRTERSSLISTLYRESELDVSYTGGTTGTHTTFYRDHECRATRVGRQLGVLQLCGYQPGMKRALVWGVRADLPSSGGTKSLKRWFREFASGARTLACTVMSDHDLADYHRRLIAFGADVLYGYPRALEQLARFVTDRRLKPLRFKTIITTAERVTPQLRAFLEQAFDGVVFNLYCTREYGCVGFECENHEGFHIDTGSVFVEIIRDEKPVAPGEVGEITITDLLNRGMPLIRSRTGDMGSLSPDPCSCGLPLPLVKSLDGRVTDILYRPDGTIIAGIMLPDLFMDMPAIEAAQFVQRKLDELDVLLVVNAGYTKSIEQEASRQVREMMGPDMKVNLVLVPEIQRNPRSGKYQEVICEVAAEEARARRVGKGQEMVLDISSQEMAARPEETLV